MTKDYNGPKGPHPVYGHALSGRPNTINGVIFRPYRRGICAYVRVSDDFRIEVYQPLNSRTWRASLDGVGLPKNYRIDKNACAAAIALMKAGICQP